MKVALIQFGAGRNKEKNMEKAVSMVDAAAKKKAEFVLLPEVYNYRGKLTGKNISECVERIPGPSTRPLLEMARQKKIYILAGSILERAKDKTKAYNTSILINPLGEIKARYRKINLFEAVLNGRRIRESNNLLTGKCAVMSKVRRFNLGLSICYDLRFPGLYQKYAQMGAHMLCVPSSFTKETGLAHFKVLLRARAIENACYVLAANQIGRDGNGVQSYGHSMIIDPWGKVLAEGSGNEEEIIFSSINMLYLKRRRQVLPKQKKGVCRKLNMLAE